MQIVIEGHPHGDQPVLVERARKDARSSHTRKFEQRFLGVPVFGYGVTTTVRDDHTVTVGKTVSGLGKEIEADTPTLSRKKAIQVAVWA